MKKYIFLFFPFIFCYSQIFSQVIEGISKPGVINISQSFENTQKYFAKNIQRWAVVIGISQYKYANKGITPLRYADADAKAFYDFLKTP